MMRTTLINSILKIILLNLSTILVKRLIFMTEFMDLQFYKMSNDYTIQDAIKNAF